MNPEEAENGETGSNYRGGRTHELAGEVGHPSQSSSRAGTIGARPHL